MEPCEGAVPPGGFPRKPMMECYADLIQSVDFPGKTYLTVKIPQRGFGPVKSTST